MKNLAIYFISVLLLAIFSCQSGKENGTNDCYISSADSLAIVNEVIASMDAWANASNNLEAEKAAEFWDSSAELIFIENTNEYPNWEAIRDYLIEFYSAEFDSFNLVWTERNIRPLTKNLASVYGRYECSLEFSSGEKIHAIPYFSALMIRVEGKWKVWRGHESYDLID